MRKKLTLESQIVNYLTNRGNSSNTEMVKFFHEKTGVPIEKINFRLNKLILQKKLLSENGLVALKNIDHSRSLQRYDEVFEFGPVRLARKGRYVFIDSNLKREDLEKNLEKIKKKLPDLKNKTIQEYQRLEKIVLENSDPLDALANISINNLLTDPETYSESSFTGRQLFPEILQNIILKNKIEKYTAVKTDQNILSEIKKLLDGLLPQLINNTMFETLTRADLSQTEKDILFRVLIDFLIIRGDAYSQHYQEVSSELFSEINTLLKQKGFTIEEYWSTVSEIKTQIGNNYNQQVDSMQILLKEHSEFIKFGDEKVKEGMSITDIVENYRKGAALRKDDMLDIAKLLKYRPKEIFRIKLNDKINQKLLELLSMHFGDNESWSSPLDKSEIAIKPIIEVNNDYYCFLAVHLVRNVIQIIELVLTEAEKAQIKYSDIKGHYFEEKALKLLGKITGSKAYAGLTYPKGNEIDGILIVKDTVFLIEIKGKKKRIIAGVEDILKLTEEDFDAQVNKAFEQSQRALSYILSQEEVEFKDNAGSICLKVRKNAVTKFFLVNICVESFATLTMDLNQIKSWDPQLMKGDKYPWIVTIYDLIVLSDLLENQPQEFINYLDQRIDLAMTNDLQAVDELDFLGYFFEHGSLKKEKDVRPADYSLIQGYSEAIDRWYSYLRGEVKSAEKPKLKNPNGNGSKVIH